LGRHTSIAEANNRAEAVRAFAASFGKAGTAAKLGTIGVAFNQNGGPSRHVWMPVTYIMMVKYRGSLRSAVRKPYPDSPQTNKNRADVWGRKLRPKGL
jgi:hypothetical protein